MTNRLKKYFGDESSEEISNLQPPQSDLSKLIRILNKSFSPHVQAKMIGDEAKIRCKNKTVWIDQHCLVTGEASTPL
jgi:hypothetical protein